MPVDALRELVLPALPARFTGALYALAESRVGLLNAVSELRVRADRIASVTVGGKNIPLGVTLSRKELADTLHRLCGNSVYAHAESIREGYLSIGGGCRVGIAGRALCEDGRIVGISDVSSLSVRLARAVPGAETEAYDVLCRLGFSSGLLVYSPPGVGKTTLLRALAVRLSTGRGARRVCVIDSRGEIDAGQLPRGALVDVLSDCPKGRGIEIAVRTPSPELLICDEIGTEEDARSILSVQYAGVPLVASAHGDSPASFGAGSPLAPLLERGVFGALLGISRGCDGVYRYRESLLGEEGAPCGALV